MTWRLYEVTDKGERKVSGWGDHSSLTSARSTIERWGRITAWNVDRKHNSVDVMIQPHGRPSFAHIVVEPVAGDIWPQC
jgi:hypothetical protein